MTRPIRRLGRSHHAARRAPTSLRVRWGARVPKWPVKRQATIRFNQIVDVPSGIEAKLRDAGGLFPEGHDSRPGNRRLGCTTARRCWRFRRPSVTAKPAEPPTRSRFIRNTSPRTPSPAATTATSVRSWATPCWRQGPRRGGHGRARSVGHRHSHRFGPHDPRAVPDGGRSNAVGKPPLCTSVPRRAHNERHDGSVNQLTTQSITNACHRCVWGSWYCGSSWTAKPC